MSLSKRLRYEVLRRDNHTCRYCGVSAPDVPLTVDHVVPESLGGPTAASNLVAACRDCNTGKGSSAPDSQMIEDVSQAHMEWAAALRGVVDQEQRERRHLEEFIDEVGALWESWMVRAPSGKQILCPRPDDWREGVATFYGKGIDLSDFDHFISRTMEKSFVTPIDKWRYLCGCLWNVVRDREKKASHKVRVENRDGDEPEPV